MIPTSDALNGINLEQHGDIDELISILQTPSSISFCDQRVNAAHELGAIGNKKALFSLLEIFASGARHQYLEGDHLGDHTARSARRIDEAVRSAIWRIIEEKDIDDSLIDALLNENHAIRSDAIGFLSHLKNPHSLLRLIDAIQKIPDYHLLSGFKDPLLNVLSGLPASEAFEAALKMLQDPCSDFREAALKFIGQSNNPRAKEAIISMLEDSSVFVRFCAADLCGRIGGTEAIVPLRKALNDTDESVRENAAEALAVLGDESPIDYLANIALDTNKNKYDRVNACRILSKFRNPPAFECLIKMLDDSNKDIRKEIAELLGPIKESRAVEPLLLLLKNDASTSCKQRAIISLGEIGDIRALKALKKATRSVNEWESLFALRAVKKLLQANPTFQEEKPESFLKRIFPFLREKR